MDFPGEEYDLRCNKAREMMDRNGLGALLVTGGCTFPTPNFRYFTGIQPREGTTNTNRPYVFLLPTAGDPIVIVWELLVQAAVRSTWVKDVRDYVPPFGPTLVKQAVEDLNLQNGKIGTEIGLDQRMHMPFIDFEEIKNILPNVEFVDAADIFWDLRMIKTEAEVRMVRESCKIACRVYQRLFDFVKEGMSLEEIYRKARIMQIEEGARLSNVTVSAGPDMINLDPHAGDRGKVLHKGDLLWVDMVVYHQGYWCDFVRMGVVGPPSDKQKKQYELMSKIVEKTMDSISWGLSGEEVVKRACGEYRRLGVDTPFLNSCLKYPFREVGHGLGLETVERPYLCAKETTFIQPGMTISIEPLGGFHPDPRIRSAFLEENILVTRDGVEIMTQYFDSSLHII